MLIGKTCGASSSRSSCEKSYLKQIGLVNVLEGDRLLADGSGKRIKSDGTAVVYLYNRFKHSPVDVIKTERVYLKLFKSIGRDVAVDYTVALYLRKVSDSLQKAIGDTGSTAGAGSDLISAVIRYFDVQNSGASF